MKNDFDGCACATKKRPSFSNDLSYFGQLLKAVVPFVTFGKLVSKRLHHLQYRNSVIHKNHIFCFHLGMFPIATASQHAEAETKWPSFRRHHFQTTYFPDWKCVGFDWICTESCSQGSYYQQVIGGPDNYLVPTIHNLTRWRSRSLTFTCVTRLQWVNVYQGFNSLWDRECHMWSTAYRCH